MSQLKQNVLHFISDWVGRKSGGQNKIFSDRPPHWHLMQLCYSTVYSVEQFKIWNSTYMAKKKMKCEAITRRFVFVVFTTLKSLHIIRKCCIPTSLQLITLNNTLITKTQQIRKLYNKVLLQYTVISLKNKIRKQYMPFFQCLYNHFIHRKFNSTGKLHFLTIQQRHKLSVHCSLLTLLQSLLQK